MGKEKMKDKVRYLISLFIFAALLAVVCSIPDDETSATNSCEAAVKPATIAKKVVKPKSKIKVTFIELGSVRCVPCRMMQPIMEEIKKEYFGKVKVEFYDVWTEEGRPYAEKYNINAIPTQIFLDENGKEYYRHVGFFPKDEIIKILELKGIRK